MPLSRARSVPGLICRNRSAFSAVVVRRGSTTMQLGAGLEPVGHAQEQDRMAVGHVRADDEEQVGGVEVGVRTRRAVGARATACSRCPHWPCTAASSTRCARCAGSPWPAWSPDTAPRWTSGRTRTAPPRRGRVRRRSPAAAGRLRRRPRRPARQRVRRRATARTSAVVSRPSSAAISSACVAPLVHSRPKLVGCSRSPDTLAITGNAGSGVGAGLHRDPAADTAIRARGSGRDGQRRSRQPAPTGAGARPTCSPALLHRVCIRRNTNHVTTAQMT